MTKDKPSPSASNRRNLYWTEEMEKALGEIAAVAHAAGFKGMYQSNDEINRTAVIRHTINMTERAQGREETKWNKVD